MNTPRSLAARVVALVPAGVLVFSANTFAQRMNVLDASAQPVVVETAEIKTEIVGRIAVTTFDLVFRNPNPRILEGTFTLPLLEGQSIVRFALDINGHLREAVPVDKTRGRVVFEAIERRRIDPGLLEQTAGNNYRARVFPLPARGTRRIVIACQETLGRGAHPSTYRLNLDFPDALKQFRLVIAALGAEAAPEMRTTLGLDLPAWQPRQVIEMDRQDFIAQGVLEIELPSLRQPAVTTTEFNGTEYFYAEAPIKLAPRPRPAPRIVGLLWDSSGSGRHRDHEREFALLDAWFQSVPNVEVRLIRLRDQAAPPEILGVKNGDWTALKAALTRTDYDGATSLDGITDDEKVDEWLLFSDGLINYGATSNQRKLELAAPVHAVVASPRADFNWLRAVAMKSRGEFVNALELTPSGAAERLRQQSMRVLAVDYHRDEIREPYPEAGLPVTDGPLMIAGILRGDAGKIRVRVGTSGFDSQEVELTIGSGQNRGDLAARAWATAKIAQLAMAPTVNAADIRRTSRDFGIVTADTSLIVLETVADYVLYDIAPPAELHVEWNAQRRFQTRERRKERDQHLESVVAAWADRVRWWERQFPKGDRPAPDFSRDGKRISRRPEPVIRPAPASTDRMTGTGTDVLPIRDPQAPEEEVIVLSPFEVSADSSGRYMASNTISGTRLRTGLADAASAVTTNSFQTTQRPAGGTITLQPWQPDAGYLNRLQRAESSAAYGIYLEERIQHERTPGFYLDVAEFFLARGDAMLGRRILSNLAELELEDVALLRVLAHRLAQADRPDLAHPLFERVLALRDDEPQSRRDLALVCIDLRRYQRAVDLLWEVVSRSWDVRFSGIELIALAELNALAATCGESLDLSRIDRRLQTNLPLQTRVVLTWDANDCDIDLWVTDPNGEETYHGNRLSYQGGRLAEDLTAGYGPEEFALRTAKPGTYRVDLEYYADSRMTAMGPVTAQLRFITDFGLPTQQEKRTTVRLDHNQRTLNVGAFEVVPASKKDERHTRNTFGVR